jgi:toxin FitB
MNVVDSSGWGEYFQDSRRADLFAPAIEPRDQLLVPVIAMHIRRGKESDSWR